MTKRLALVAAAVACWSTVAGATSINSPRQGTPDIFSDWIDVTYDPSSGMLTATGFAEEINLPPKALITGPGPAGEGWGTFGLSIRVDSQGNLDGPGTDTDLVIGGNIPALGLTDGSEPLLTGRVVQFGFPDAGGDPLEFVFSVTGGEAAHLYGGVGFLGVVELHGSGFPIPASFDLPFYSFGMALSDTYVVPEPLTVLVVVPLILVGRVARRRASLPCC